MILLKGKENYKMNEKEFRLLNSMKGCSNCSHYHLHAISCISGNCNPHDNLTCKDNTHGKHIIALKK